MSNLTQRQMLFWLGQHRHPAVPLYNMTIEFEIRGAVDTERFRAAFERVVLECDALRSVFHEKNHQVIRSVLPSIPSPIEIVDLRQSDNAVEECDERVRAQSVQAFDLAVRCFSAELVQLEAERFVFFMAQHHLIGDGASIRILYDAIEAAYTSGGTPEIGSADSAFIEEQKYLLSKASKADRDFWTARRKPNKEETTFYSRPEPHSSRQVERLEVKLTVDQSQRLRDLAVQHGLPLLPDLGMLSLLETVLFAYLYRVNGQAFQSLGTPVRNRRGRAAKTAVGCFIEMLPIQVEIEPGDTFGKLLERTQNVTKEGLAHSRACLANSETNPLYNVTVNYHTEKYTSFAGFSSQIRFSTGLHAMELPPSVEYWPGGDALGLHCHDYTGSGSLTLWFDFHALRFDPEQRQRAVGHFMRLFDAALENLDTKISDVPIVSEAERETLLALGRGPEVPADGRTFVDLFVQQAKETPKRVAVRSRHGELTYGRLEALSRALALELRERGVSADQCVGMCLSRSLHVHVAWLAILRSGGACVPLDPTHPAKRIARILEVSSPQLILTESEYDGLFGAEADRILMDRWQPRDESKELPDPPGLSNLAYVLFTSGSTGLPKGVGIEHWALVNFLRFTSREPGIGPDDRLLATATIAFDISIYELLLPLTCGACVELVDSSAAVNPALLQKEIEERKPTIIQATPTGWRLLVETGWIGGANIKALSGGEPLPVDLAHILRARVGELWNGYGPTETTIYSSMYRVDTDPTGASVGIGRAFDNTTLYVFNESMQLAPMGVVGELYIGGAGLGREYLNNPEQTAQRFVKGPECVGGIRLYRSGDLAALNPDGTFECRGRADSQVKIRGYRIELGEVEHALLQLPEVGSGVVVVRATPQGEKVLAAYVVPAEGYDVQGRDIRSRLAESVPSYMVPASCTIVKEFFRTESGKVDRKRLPEPEQADRTDDYLPPRTNLEYQIANIYEELLGVSPVGREDDFFSLGGHSLLALQLLTRLNEHGREPLGIGAIFQSPRVDQLAQRISQGARADAPLIVPLNRAVGTQALFCVRGLQIYRQLAEAVGRNFQVYGVHLPAEVEIFKKAREGGKRSGLEALASEYVAAIRRQAPNGPYNLAGVSFAGGLAYEVATQLRAAGEEVHLLALFDAMLPSAKRATWWRGALQTVRKFSGPALRRPNKDAQAQAEKDWQMADFARAVKEHEHFFRPYDGDVKLFSAQQRNLGAGWSMDRHLGWGELISKIELIEVPSGHLDLLKQPVVQKLADHIVASLSLLSYNAPESVRSARSVSSRAPAPISQRSP